MIARNPNQRVAVLVDVQNLYYSAKNLYSSKINYKNLLQICVRDRTLTRAIAYVINADQEGEGNNFFDAVNSAGFETKEKPLQTFFGGAKKGDWDVGIAMDAVRLGAKVDAIVLCTGDGDFKPVVNYLQQASGCLVEVIAFKSTANKELMELADDFTDIEEFTDSLIFREKKIFKRRS
jgi:uncharacterized LabA/DUF88 family protein